MQHRGFPGVPSRTWKLGSSTNISPGSKRPQASGASSSPTSRTAAAATSSTTARVNSRDATRRCNNVARTARREPLRGCESAPSRRASHREREQNAEWKQFRQKKQPFHGGSVEEEHRCVGRSVGVYMHVTDLCPKWLLNGEWAANRETRMCKHKEGNSRSHSDLNAAQPHNAPRRDQKPRRCWSVPLQHCNLCSQVLFIVVI